MSVAIAPRQGMTCWVELRTPHVTVSRAFYCALFGWSAVHAAAPSKYGTFRRNGLAVAGLAGVDADASVWLPYLRVDSVETAVSQAERLGGSVLAPTAHAMPAVRTCRLLDPVGAAVGLWQNHPDFGLECVNQPSALCWIDLETANAKLAGGFYQELLPWMPRSGPDDTAGRYTVYTVQEQMTAGIAEVGTAPSRWVPYFGVDDLVRALQRLDTLGGACPAPPRSTPGVGRLATVQDPSGAWFGLVERSALV